MVNWLAKKRLISLALMLFVGCTSREIKPVDIYPEDNCSHCRMAISDQSFASEIITQENEVYKFDDIGCAENFKQESPSLKIAATFVKDYTTKNWLRYDKAVFIETKLITPMGSGKIAFADSSKAKEFAEKYSAMTGTE